LKTYTESITKVILDESTGELSNETFTRDYKQRNNIKQGWTMTYIDYDEMLATVIKSNLDMKIVMHLKRLIKSDFTLTINISKEAERMGLGRDKLSKTLSRLVAAEFLKRTDTGFRSNPFMFIPYRPIDAVGEQKRWKEEKV